jgi:hypothetical protein
MSLRGGLFPPLQRFRRVLRRALRAEVTLAEIEGRLRGFRRGGFEVTEGDLRTPRDRAAAKIGIAYEIHRLRVALVRGEVGPAHGLCLILSHALRIAIPVREG